MSDPGSIVPFPDLKAIELLAAEWVTRLDSEDATPQERVAFNAWLEKSPLHLEVFTRHTTRWQELDRLEALNDYAASVDIGGVRQTPALGSAWSRRSILVGSGATALAGAAALYLRTPILGKTNPGMVRTAVGERRTTTLDDGSTIELNTNSLIAVSYSEKLRAVHLLKGEAYFDVSPNPQRPFRVYARAGAIQVVGTAFTVRLHRANINLIVQEGRVALSPQGPHQVDSTMVQAGQDAVFAERIEHVANLDAAALSRKLAWRDGILSFAGEPLSEVLADMSRYTDTDIEIADQALRELPVDGHFKIGNLDSMLEALEVMAHVKIERLGPHKIRLSKSI
jgi:transmembrane sensor